MEIRHAEALHELLSGPDIVQYIKFIRLQWVSHILWMKPKEILDGEFRRRRPVGRPRLRWKYKIRRDLSLLLNVRGWRKLAGDMGYLEVNSLTGQRENVSFLAVCEATSVSWRLKIEVEVFVFVLGHKNSRDLDSRTYSTDISYDFLVLKLLILLPRVMQPNRKNIMSSLIVIEFTGYWTYGEFSKKNCLSFCMFHCCKVYCTLDLLFMLSHITKQFPLLLLVSSILLKIRRWNLSLL